eukprot:gene12458-13746_t
MRGDVICDVMHGESQKEAGLVSFSKAKGHMAPKRRKMRQINDDINLYSFRTKKLLKIPRRAAAATRVSGQGSSSRADEEREKQTEAVGLGLGVHVINIEQGQGQEKESSGYFRKKEKLLEKWDEVRDSLIRTTIESLGDEKECDVCFCDCISDAKILLSHGLWPVSRSKPVFAIEVQLVDFLECLFLESQVKHMYNSLSLNDTFDQYPYFKYRLRNLRTLRPVVSDGTVCPACPKVSLLCSYRDLAQFSGIWMLALVSFEKKCAGKEPLPSLHGPLYFEEQDEVDNFLAAYKMSGKEKENDLDKECNQFQADGGTSLIHSKGRNHMFDEKEPFGCVRRHEFPTRFLNIKHGERFGYAIYLLEQLMDSTVNTDIKKNVVYDIGFKLEQHVEITKNSKLFGNVSFMVPEFHAFAHSTSCQDCLTDAMLHHSQKAVIEIGALMVDRLVRARNACITSETELKKLLSSLSVGIDDAIEWAQELTKLISKIFKDAGSILLSNWKCKYVTLLLVHKQRSLDIIRSANEEKDGTTSGLVKRKASIEDQLKVIENANGINRRWKLTDPCARYSVGVVEKQIRDDVIMKLRSLAFDRWFLLSLKQKYSTGQKIANGAVKEHRQQGGEYSQSHFKLQFKNCI